jgi:hypothetical protein
MSPRKKAAKTTTKYLDPKIDVIFKMLFANENHKSILAGFISELVGRNSVDRNHYLIQETKNL